MGHNHSGDSPRKKSFHVDTNGQVVLVAVGGESGVGNAAFSGNANRRAMSVPANYLPGDEGQARSLLLELKLIAEIGLVGFPNAGKSTLLAAVSNATPKIAPYPFTTLHPNIGIMAFSDGQQISVADIPGLIDGAHEDRGLGHDFLRHIERTKVLLYVIDSAAVDGRQPHRDLRTLIRELEMYDPKMMKKPAFVFANKCDVLNVTGKNYAAKLEEEARANGLRVLYGSAQEGIGIGPVAELLRSILEGESTGRLVVAGRKKTKGKEGR